jgi:hypothetical protein
MAQFATFRLQQRSGIGNRNRLRRRAHFHGYVDANRLGYRNFDVLPHEGLESRRRNCKFVGAGRNL